MEKKTQQEYCERIRAKKQEAHDRQWLYIELNAKELNQEIEPKVSNVSTAAKALLECMLEGDGFIVEPKSKSRIGGALTVRYYCDNLSPERRTYKEANPQ